MAEERVIRINKVLRELNLSLDRAVDFLKEKDIHIESSPNAKISQSEYDLLCYQFSYDNKKKEASMEVINRLVNNGLVINKIRREIQEKEAQNKIKNDKKLFTVGNVVNVSITKIIAPSQIVTSYVGGFVGRLSVLDISWSLPQGEEVFKKYKIGSNIQAVILKVDEKKKQIILSQKHLVKPLNQTAKWEKITRGEEVNLEIVQNLHKNYIVKTNNLLFGLLNKNVDKDTLKNENFRINAKLNEANLLEFIPIIHQEISESKYERLIEEHASFIEPELRTFSNFKQSILGNTASKEQLKCIEKGFELDNNIFSKEIDTGVTFYIQFRMSDASYENNFKSQAIPYFLNGEKYNDKNEKILLDKLSNEKYWFKLNTRIDKKNNKENEPKEIIEFTLYNNEINFYGEVIKDNKGKDVKFLIKNFSFGQSFQFASVAKKNNEKYGSFLLNNKVKLVAPNGVIPFDDSQSKFLNYCITKTECFEIYQNLKLESGEILKQEGRALGIIDKFLEFQIDLLKKDKANSIEIKDFKRVKSNKGNSAIQIPQVVGDRLELAEDNIVNIRVVKDQKKQKISEGVISIINDEYQIDFINEINLTNLENGFYIDVKVSTRQFDIQREIIKDFLERKIKIDHIESLLVNPEKVKNPIKKQVTFINEDLQRTKEEQPDNNQIKAVEKAIGNQNVFLIQGPPGTGKTTVIAEIIEQLTKKGEKILVTGQNHVAVDNVLEKISRKPNLNLLRVGNIERIDESLVKYCYENLVEEYKLDFKKFITNQKELTKLLLAFNENNTESTEQRNRFKDKVYQLAEYYNSQKETFIQKHFLLRDNVSNLSEQELIETITILENWENSFSKEYEILLQPFIYNSVDVVFATCIGIKGDKIFRETNFKFDTVIIDEAGKANIAESLVAMELGKKIILVGDQMQLPPYMDSSLLDKNDKNSFPNSIYGYGFTEDEIARALKTSFFEFIVNRIDIDLFPKDNKEMLNYQHRMHPNIGKFVSESFYGAEVEMGSRTHLNRLNLPAPFDKEIIFFDTSNTSNPYEIKSENAVKNDTEAEYISEFILPELFKNEIDKKNIAIIAPYKFQVSNIKNFIKKSTLCQQKNIDVATLDSFQGKEYDIIIFSFTRASNFSKPTIINGKKISNKVGFLDDARRLNVAFSRAKKKLILVGNATTLTDKRSHFDLLFNYTDLFKKLVKLSRKTEIGNFINIANYNSSIKSFKNFYKEYKEGDIVEAKFDNIGKTNEKMFGAFFYIDGVKALLPKSHIPNHQLKYFEGLEKGQTIKLSIYKIDKDQDRITLILPLSKKERDNIALSKRNKYWDSIKDSISVDKTIKAIITKKVEFGYFVKLDNIFDALLHNRQIPENCIVNINDEIEVKIHEIDYNKKQIAVKI